MTKTCKKDASYCSPTFGQWWLMSLVVLLFGIFPIAGSAEELLASQILHISCNGDANDQSGMGHTVENSGVTFMSDKLGHHGRTCFFDGSDYLRILKHPDFNLSNFTIAVWVLVEGSYNGTDTRAIISNYAGGGDAQHYGINMTKGVSATFYDEGIALNGATDTGGANLNDGQWHHITAVFEAGVNTKLYVDGVPRRQTAGTMPASITPTGDLYIGRGGVSELMEKRWVGSIDDVRILNRVLSKNEINQLLGIIDFPTGETITPLGVEDNDPFVITVKDAPIDPIMVTPKDDYTYSLNMMTDGNSNVRDGDRTQPSATTTFTIHPNDGGVTLVDTAEPSVVAKLNAFLDLEVTDTKVPELRLILQRNSDRFAFQSIDNPSIVVRVNHDGTLDIVDETKRNISITRHKDGTYTIVDQDARTVTLVNRSGDAVLRHTEYPDVAATFNIFESQGEYTLVNIDGSECIQINADGSIGSNIRGGIISKVFSVVGTAISAGVRSAINTLGSAAVAKTVKAVVAGGAKILGTAATIVQKKFTAWFDILPHISKFAVSGILGRLRAAIDAVKTAVDASIRRSVRLPLPAIAAGAVLVGAAVAALFFGKMKKEIAGLRAEVQRLNAIVQVQAQQIADLERTVAEQAQTIQRLEEIIVGLKEIIDEQAQKIDEQATRIGELEDRVAAQDEAIAKQAEMNAVLQNRLAVLEEQIAQANEGVDKIPAGEPIAGPFRAIRGNQCNALVNEAREILGLEQVVPATCQLYGVQDQALNDSIFFTYSPQDNSTVQIGEIHKGCDIEAMAIDPNSSEIYLASGDSAASCPKGELYKLDAVTGELRAVGPTGFRDISGLAFDNDGNLWGWAKGQGLITLDTYTAQGQLVQPSAIEFADLTWDSTQQVLYSVVGTELWSYSPIDKNINKVCSNLPHKTEAVRVLPTSILSEGLVLLGSHQNSQFKLQVFDIVNCQEVVNQAIFVGYDDVEGFDMPLAACQ